MKKKLFFSACILLLVPTLLVAQPTHEEIRTSIDDGLTWLVAQQDVDGSFGGFHHDFDIRVATTAFVMTKLCDYAYEQYPRISPFDSEYAYYSAVIDGFDFLLSQVKDYYYPPLDVFLKPGLCVTPSTDFHYEIYSTAVSLMAFAASGTPDRVIISSNPLVNGLTYLELTEAIVEYLAAAQAQEISTNPAYGSWSYTPNRDEDGDNSHTGYVTLGLRYAEAFGCSIPQEVKDRLGVFIDVVQDDVTGGSVYNPTSEWTGIDWINQLKTGNLLFEMSFVGDALSSTRAQFALSYITNHWWDESIDPGWGDLQAMYCLMKGFESFGIDLITVGTEEIDWYQAFASKIIDTQEPDGSWPPSLWEAHVVSTCWALFVLEKVAPPPPIKFVDLDIHPTSWPNPLNVDLKGVTPVAILGTADFDVLTVDPTSLLLEGVPPLRWAYEDVTGPAEGEGPCNDTQLGGDGYMDMTLKFKTQDLVAAIGEVSDGDELVLVLTGQDYEGEDIEGDDCVRILVNTQKNGITEMPELDSSLPSELHQNYPNPFSNNTTLGYNLTEDSYVILKVFNMYGQEIETLVDKTKAKGEHKINFDARNFPAGIYYYTLSTNDKIQSKRMILRK